VYLFAAGCFQHDRITQASVGYFSDQVEVVCRESYSDYFENEMFDFMDIANDDYNNDDSDW